MWSPGVPHMEQSVTKKSMDYDVFCSSSPTEQLGLGLGLRTDRLVRSRWIHFLRDEKREEEK